MIDFEAASSGEGKDCSEIGMATRRFEDRERYHTNWKLSFILYKWRWPCLSSFLCPLYTCVFAEIDTTLCQFLNLATSFLCLTTTTFQRTSR
jgi:hypothetical protein